MSREKFIFQMEICNNSTCGIVAAESVFQAACNEGPEPWHKNMVLCASNTQKRENWK